MKRKLSEKVGVLFLATVLFLSATVVSFGAGDDHSGIEEEDESWNDEIDENLYLSKPIYDWNNLNDVRNDLSSAYLLMNDLTSDTDGYDTWVGTVDGWDPIGDDVAPFTGTFDGNGFTISDLYINRPTEEFVGLFGYIDGAEIKDVELVDVDVTGEQRVGGLVGRNEGLVSNTSSIGSVEGASGYYNGVLIGYNNDNGDVYSSYSSGTVTGSNGLGGLCGLNRGSISNSYSTANVIGTGSYIGGLVGEHRGEITNAYSKGEVSGGSSVGGLVGWSSGTVVDSFWDTDTSGHTWSAGDETGKTTEEMKDIATYTDTTTVGLVTPWDFVDDPNDDVGDEDIWHIHERINYGYPFLTWEPSAIYDWHDLDSIRNDLDGDYILMNDIDENSEGYWDYNNQVEASHEIREDAGYQQTWDDGDTIKIRFDDGDYDSILGVEDDGGNPIAHTVGEDITIDEDTGERYVYVFYENALVGWEPIGEFDSDNLDLAFRGTFDGDGHEIRDLYIHRPGENDVGLFGCILAGSLVENIGITGSTVSGGTRVGTLVGNHRGDVNNSYANGYVSGFFTVGGLVGRSYFRSVTNSYAAGEVTGYRLVGGLVGYNMYADVLNSYSTCTVTADQSLVGGLVGYNHGFSTSNSNIFNSYATGEVTGIVEVGGLVGRSYSNTTVSDCYATGSVTGENNVGGLVGVNTYYQWGDVFEASSILNSYSIGTVSGVQEVGGLIGFNDQSIVYNSFWDTETSGTEIGVGEGDQDGATGKTTVQMKDVATFTDLSTDGLDEPWDFVGNPNDDVGDDDVWDIHENFNDGYPFFIWKPSAIYDWHDLNAVRNDLSGNYTLMNDLTTETDGYSDYNTGEGWEPIGHYDESWTEYPFTGKFDGQGYTIDGLYINRTEVDGSGYLGGLFGFIEGGIIENLGVTNVDITNIHENWGAAGAIVAFIGTWDSSISNCHASGTVIGTIDVGVLVGVNDGTVKNSYAAGTAVGTHYVGGLVGHNMGSSTISGSHTSSEVFGESNVGGLVGRHIGDTIKNSYSTGAVTRNPGSESTGIAGFVGHNYQAKIINCYSTGQVIYEGDTNPTDKGFAGEVFEGNDYEMRNNFWDIESSGQGSTAGNATGKTTEEMQNYETFTNTDTEGLDEPWDIMVVAAPDLEDDYPYLGWEAGNGAVWYIEQMAYAVSFDVSVDDIVAGEQPIVEVYDAVDQFGEPLEGDYFSTIEIGGEFETASLSFVGGEASYTWEQMVEAGDFTATVTIDGVTESDLFIVNVGEVHTVTISPVDNQTIVTAGEDLPFNAEAFDEYGNLITGDVSDFDWVGAEINGVFNQEVIGDYDVTASYGEVTSDPVTITVEPGDVDYIEIAPSESTITIGDSETYTAFAYDEYGNEIGDVTADTAWDIDANAGGSWTDNVYTSENDGTWTVTGTYEGVADEATLMVIEETGFIPENLELDVGPIQGEPPLTVTIYVSGENTGEEAGSIDVIVDGTVEYTLQIPADSSADHTFTHTFDEVGSYLVEFHDLTKTVTVGDVIEFVPENIVLDVTPTYGEPGLEVTISVSGDNAGELDGEIDVIVDGTVEYTLVIPAEESADHTFTYTFYELGTYQIEFYDSTETVYVIDTKGFAPVDLELDVDPISGEPPLTVTIFVSAENVGDEDGSIDVVVDGTIEYTLNLPSGESAEHTFTHTFDEGGTYEVELSHIIKTVDVAILPPIISIETLEDGIIFDTDSVSIGWICDEGTYSISHYEIRLNNDDWEDIGKVLEYTFEDLDDGEYTVYIRAVDEHGNDAITSLDFIIDTIDEGDDEDPFFMNPMILGLLILIIAVIVGLILFAMKKKSSGTPPETTPAESETPPPPPAQSQQENMYTPENEGSDAIDGGEDFDQNPMDDESKPIDEAEDIDVDPKAKD